MCWLVRTALSKGAAGEIAELLNRDLELEGRPFQAKDVETKRADLKAAGHRFKSDRRLYSFLRLTEQSTTAYCTTAVQQLPMPQILRLRGRTRRRLRRARQHRMHAPLWSACICFGCDA